MLPGVVFEDEHLLVFNKPAGLNTHAATPFGREGLFEILRNYQPEWSSLAIVHRLDQDTSGLIIFTKTPLANKSLTEQFTRHEVKKLYRLLSDRRIPGEIFEADSHLARQGDTYASVHPKQGGLRATTRFSILEEKSRFGAAEWQAEPLTGRTHQIRVHAAEHKMPILGDVRYGGSPAERVHLHSCEISFDHPASRKRLHFACPPDWNEEPAFHLRKVLIDPAETDAFRVLNGAAEGNPGLSVEKLGDYLLNQAGQPLSDAGLRKLEQLRARYRARGVYHKFLSRDLADRAGAQASAAKVAGEAAPARFVISENNVKYELTFEEGYSYGLFLDQRANRRRLLNGYVTPGFELGRSAETNMLNLFAYTCGFSLCAALGGSQTTNIDLSKKYLEWGKRNFVLNGIDPDRHRFLYGDAFDWFRRLAKKQERFDVIVLDPPTFSRSREHGIFRAEKDYPRLLRGALALLPPQGVILASSNAADWDPAHFVELIHSIVRQEGGKIVQSHYAPQPFDFRTVGGDPGHLKTLWLRIAR